MSEQSQQTNAGLFHAQKLVDFLVAHANSAGAVDAKVASSSEPTIANALDVSCKSIEFAAWQCVKSAWTSWLSEVIAFGSKGGSALVSFDELSKQKHIDNPNMVHLINLNMEPSSWVSELLTRVGESGKLSQTATAKPNEHAFNALSLVDLDTKTELDVLNDVIAGFKQHVMATRAQQQEW